MGSLVQAVRPAAVLAPQAAPLEAGVAAKGGAQTSIASEMNASPRVLQLRALAARMNATPRVPGGAPVQRQANPAAASGGPGAAPARNDTRLPDGLKSGIESLSGLAMDGVEVQYNSVKPASLQAHALTQGMRIDIGPGQERHLPHEAWHVVQQMQGRVRPMVQLMGGTALNTDRALEREADVMGGRALSLGAGRLPQGGAPAGEAQLRGGIAQARSVVQMAAPGGIEHAMNSCFVAALINTFTVVRPLRNLLIPTNNALHDGTPLAGMQSLLWRAVNTVDAQHRVPANWVSLIMASLAVNGIIVNAVDTADFSQVMAGVVAALTPGNAARGQANAMPASSGEVIWYPNQTLDAAAGERVAQLQNHAMNFNLSPNSIHVTRGVANQQVAPQSFNLYPANGTTVTYRLRSIIERDTKYEGGHFISYADRGADGQQEWWRSDDLHPDAVAAVGNLGASGMQRQGYAYIYERSDAALAVGAATEVGDVAADALRARYNKDLTTYVLAALGDKQDKNAKLDIDKIDKTKFDKNLQIKAEDKSNALKSSVKAFKLPSLVVSREMAPEVMRQLRLQLDSLNRLSVKDWAFQVMLNRMKSTDQLVAGYAKGAGVTLKTKVDKILKESNVLASILLDEIKDRMIPLQKFFNQKTEPQAYALVGTVYNRAALAKLAKEPWAYFEFIGGVKALAELSMLSVKGGIGRQHGEGDNTWFRRQHDEGILMFEHDKPNTHAVLHNPDQVAGGQMEIFHDSREAVLLDQAKANFEKALAAHLKADKTAKASSARQSDKSAQANTGHAFAEAREIYRDLIGRYMGDSAVNSLLGEAWIKVLPDNSSRIEQLLDFALTVPLDRWEKTKMSVAMGVDIDDKLSKGSRKQKEATVAKKQEKVDKLLSGKKKRKSAKLGTHKPKDKRLQKLKTPFAQQTFESLAYRQSKPEMPDKSNAEKMEGSQTRFSLRFELFRHYCDYLAVQEHPAAVDDQLARWSFGEGSSDHERYLAYQEAQLSSQKKKRRTGEDDEMQLEGDSEGDEDEHDGYDSENDGRFQFESD